MSEGSYTEDHLVEQPAIQLMQHELGWDAVNCYDEWDGGVSMLERDGKRDVVLTGRLKPALRRLNPDLPVEAIEGAVEEICRDRTALSLAEANGWISVFWVFSPPGETGLFSETARHGPWNRRFHGYVKILKA